MTNLGLIGPLIESRWTTIVLGAALLFVWYVYWWHIKPRRERRFADLAGTATVRAAKASPAEIDRHNVSTISVSATATVTPKPPPDDSEFPVLVNVAVESRPPHRERLCAKRAALIAESKDLEKSLVDLPIGTPDNGIKLTAVHRWQRSTENWGTSAGLGAVLSIRDEIAKYHFHGGDMGPKKRQEYLAAIRGARAWLRHHRHGCPDE